METVKTLKVYNLLNENGDRLTLRLGIIRHRMADGLLTIVENGWRWSFEGKQIPMPVRSRTWFNGFPESIMLDWLKGNGWYPQTCVDMGCGYAKVFELPVSKGNKESVDYMVDKAITCALKLMWENGNHIKAIHLYRLLYGGTLDGAQIAIKGIVDRQI